MKNSSLVPRSRLATIAHRMVSRSGSEREAAEKIVQSLSQSEGLNAELEVAEVNNEDHWVAIIPADRTNYDTSFRKVAVVPDMSVREEFAQNHIGIITPDDS